MAESHGRGHGAPLLEVDTVVKHFPPRHRGGAPVQAVDGVSFELDRGETLAIVGESGCGKTTLARLLVRLDEPTAGSIRLRGRDIHAGGGADLKALRRTIQIVFQDPYASLNPRMTAGEIIAEGWEIHDGLVEKADRSSRLAELMELVGLDPGTRRLHPDLFSGGQRQRIGIARALAVQPEILVCDEPVSALDVSVQAQIINLLLTLQQKLGLAYVFIAHDLSVVRHMTDRVAVMYLGKVVEVGQTDTVFDHPLHPYSQALLSAVPSPDPRLSRSGTRIVLEGEVPSPTNPPSGCRFRTRCWKAAPICSEQVPELVTRGFDHPSACHFAQPLESAPGKGDTESTGPPQPGHRPRRNGGDGNVPFA
jgi:oligopeptide transport system ATP-binding protein